MKLWSINVETCEIAMSKVKVKLNFFFTVTADSMNSAVFQAGAAVRDSVSMLSQQMAKL